MKFTNTRALTTMRLCGVALCVLVFAANAARAQGASSFAPDSPRNARAGKRAPNPESLLAKPSQPPAYSVPVEPLGFSSPGALYLGQRNTLVSLDFIDENRLLFTFRVPGLMHRETLTEGQGEQGYERQIRAVVLSLPVGIVESEALWTVHDRSRYLWMLRDGRFLLRDGDELKQGDASLQLKPKLRFPGPLLWLQMDPAQQYLVTNSQEPVQTAAVRPGDVASPATAAANLTVDGENPAPDEVPDKVVRILNRETGKVMLVSRARSTVHLAINSDGYLESLRSQGAQWLLNLSFFKGGSRVLGRVDSTCAPSFDFVSEREVLTTTCVPNGSRKLVAMDTEGRRLWEDPASEAAVWPLVVMAPDGSRLARETLAVSHSINAYQPLSREDIKGQLVEVFDAANGAVALTAPASPALDAGGNVAISPGGRRVAVLNEGAIQVYELGAPAVLPASGGVPPENHPR